MGGSHNGGGKDAITEETKAKIVEYLAKGNYRETAHRLAGISGQAFYRMMREGKNPESKHHAFRVAVLAAEASCEQAIVAKVINAADRDWQAGAWFLRHGPARERFRPVEKSEQKIQVETSKMTDKELLEAAQAILAKRTTEEK